MSSAAVYDPFASQGSETEPVLESVELIGRRYRLRIINTKLSMVGDRLIKMIAYLDSTNNPILDRCKVSYHSAGYKQAVDKSSVVLNSGLRSIHVAKLPVDSRIDTAEELETAAYDRIGQLLDMLQDNSVQHKFAIKLEKKV